MLLTFGSLYFLCGTVRPRKQETTYKKLSLSFFVLNTPDYKKHFSLPLTILFLIFWSLYFLCFLYLSCDTVRPRKQETTYKKLSLSFFVLITQDYKKQFNIPLTILFLTFGSLYLLYLLCGTVRPRKQETTYKKLSLSFFVLITQDYKKQFNLPLTILFLIFGSLYFLYFLCGTVRPHKQETTYKKLSLSFSVLNTPD